MGMDGNRYDGLPPTRYTENEPMPIVIDGVIRFSVIGDLSGEACVNIIDVDVNTATGQTREEACFQIAGDILNNWTDHILPNLSGAYTALEVRWVDLNSADGSTGSRTDTSAETWPQPGARSGSPLPNNTYAKVRKILAGKSRTERAGTLRLGGILEEDTIGGVDNNVLASSAQNAYNTAFQAFADGINQDPPLPGHQLCVVHTVNRVATGKSDIESFQVAPVVGTLRRRMPGYGS